MIFKKFVPVLALTSCLLFYVRVSYSDVLDIDPNVYAVYSGPMKWSKGGGKNLRFIIILSEVYLSVYIQKIEYGSENCCAKVVNNYQLESGPIRHKCKAKCLPGHFEQEL